MRPNPWPKDYSNICPFKSLLELCPRCYLMNSEAVMFCASKQVYSLMYAMPVQLVFSAMMKTWECIWHWGWNALSNLQVSLMCHLQVNHQTYVQTTTGSSYMALCEEGGEKWKAMNNKIPNVDTCRIGKMLVLILGHYMAVLLSLNYFSNFHFSELEPSKFYERELLLIKICNYISK